MNHPQAYEINTELRDRINREWEASPVRALGGQFAIFERRVLWEEIAQRETIIQLQRELIEQLRVRLGALVSA